jgi:CheY-like chemotaxis protein
MKNIALLEDSYLFRRLQSDQLSTEGVNVVTCKTTDELLAALGTREFDAILVDRYHTDLDYDAFADNFGLTLKSLGITCPIVLWTNLVLTCQELKAAGFDFHAPKTLYSKSELHTLVQNKAQASC